MGSGECCGKGKKWKDGNGLKRKGVNDKRKKVMGENTMRVSWGMK